LQLRKTGHVPRWATKVLALELFANSGQKETVACNCGKLDIRPWLARSRCLHLWKTNQCGQIRIKCLHLWKIWNATVVSNKGACIGVVHRSGQKEAVACNCGKLDTPWLGRSGCLHLWKTNHSGWRRSWCLHRWKIQLQTVDERKWCLHHGNSSATVIGKKSVLAAMDDRSKWLKGNWCLHQWKLNCGPWERRSGACTTETQTQICG